MLWLLRFQDIYNNPHVLKPDSYIEDDRDNLVQYWFNYWLRVTLRPAGRTKGSVCVKLVALHTFGSHLLQGAEHDKHNPLMTQIHPHSIQNSSFDPLSGSFQPRIWPLATDLSVCVSVSEDCFNQILYFIMYLYFVLHFVCVSVCLTDHTS